MVVEFIEKAWKAYKKNFWQVVAATILLLVIVIGTMLIGLLPLIVNGLNTLSIFTFFVTLITAIILSIVLGGGLVAVYRDALRGKAKYQKMFSFAKKKFFTILGANVLATIIIGVLFLTVFVVSSILSLINITIFFISFIFGVITVFLLSLLFYVVNQAIIVENKNAIESIIRSFNVVKSNYLQFLALTIILAVISIIVSFIPYLGFVLNWLVVAPITGMAYTHFYIKKK